MNWLIYAYKIISLACRSTKRSSPKQILCHIFNKKDRRGNIFIVFEENSISIRHKPTPLTHPEFKISYNLNIIFKNADLDSE